jgi:hypothetical protein
MVAVELMSYHVLEDPAFPAPTDEYMVKFVVFYEWGFDAPSHRFLLHIATFVSLYEAYMGVDPEFNMWTYFFHVRRPQDPDAELTVSRGTVIHVKSGQGDDPYFDITMPRSMNGW